MTGRRHCQSKRRSGEYDENTEVTDIEDASTLQEIAELRRLLLNWYDINGRDLPWRTHIQAVEEHDEKESLAYRVWVSEIMLQQTRVQTVIDYYNRWMKKWPTLSHLANASLEEVNEMWAGLGYYRRARFLLEGSKMIIASKDGFPNTVSALRKVPGIGAYTAGAIASIAFGKAVPVVDGNVVRVLARLKAISSNPKDPITLKKFWTLAAQVVDPTRPGDFNQSLMELGAMVCTPSSPSCHLCPVSAHCKAYAVSKVDKSLAVTDFPAKTPKSKPREEFSAVCVLEIAKTRSISRSEFVLMKRPEGGLLAGLWEFPSVPLTGRTDLDYRRKRIDSMLKGLFNRTCSVISREEIGDFVHTFSHIKLKIFVE